MPTTTLNSTEMERVCEQYGEAIGNRQLLLGFLYILIGTTYISLHVVCARSMLCKDLLESSCYKIMLVMSIVDIVVISFSASFSGYLSIIGASLCSHPLTMTIGGHFGFAMWCTYSGFCMILGFNRSLDILNPQLYQKFFTGPRTWFWIPLPFVYGAIGGSPLTLPFTYSSVYGIWLINPLPIVPNDYPSINKVHFVHNVITSLVLTGFYSFVYIHLHNKIKDLGLGTKSPLSKKRRQMLLQTCVSCSVYCSAAFGYVIMQIIPMPDFMYVVSQITWQNVNGGNAVIYLVFNQSIRSRAKQVLRHGRVLPSDNISRSRVSMMFGESEVARSRISLGGPPKKAAAPAPPVERKPSFVAQAIPSIRILNAVVAPVTVKLSE